MGFSSKRLSPPSYRIMLSVRPLRSTGVTPLPRYYGPLRLPSRAAPGYVFPSRVGSSPPTLQGLPGSSADLSTRAAPNHPGRPGECLPGLCFPTGFRLHPSRRTGHLRIPIEAESGSLALRLACSPIPRSPDPFLHPALTGLHVRTGNLHGELLSVHKISQAYPGVPTVREWSLLLPSVVLFASPYMVSTGCFTTARNS